MKYVVVPIGLTGVRFPDKCVYCGQAKDTYITLSPSFSSSQGNKRITHSTKIQVPYCKQHARESKQNNLIINSASVLGCLPTFIIILLVGGLLVPWRIPIRLGNIIIFLVALAIALIVGTVTQFLSAAYLSRLPFLNKSLADTEPSPIFNILLGGEIPANALGISTTLLAYQKVMVRLQFTNPTVADECAMLNGVDSKESI